MGEATGMAGRYALAVFDLARERNALDRVAADFASLSTAIRTAPDFARLIASPVFTRSQQGKGVTAVAQRMGLSDLVVKFWASLPPSAVCLRLAI